MGAAESGNQGRRGAVASFEMHEDRGGDTGKPGRVKCR